MSPRMTVKEVCTLARCERSKVDRATRLYRKSHGTKGLRYQQTSPRSQLLFRRQDVEAWLEPAELTKPQRLRAAG